MTKKVNSDADKRAKLRDDIASGKIKFSPTNESQKAVIRALEKPRRTRR